MSVFGLFDFFLFITVVSSKLAFVRMKLIVGTVSYVENFIGISGEKATWNTTTISQLRVDLLKLYNSHGIIDPFEHKAVVNVTMNILNIDVVIFKKKKKILM